MGVVHTVRSITAVVFVVVVVIRFISFGVVLRTKHLRRYCKIIVNWVRIGKCC